MNYTSLTDTLHKLSTHPEMPVPLINACTQIYNSNSITGYTSSRNLADALNSTVSQWSSTHELHIYKFLYSLCTLLNPTKNRIKIMPYYRTISTEQANTITIGDLLVPHSRIEGNADTIHICYISKGKTFAQQLLNSPDNIATNLKNIEAILIQEPGHFIKVYKGFEGTNPNDITIFTDIANYKLIQAITTLLPLLFNIVVKEIPENIAPEIAEEIANYNLKVVLLTDIFEALFNTLKEQRNTSDDATDRIRKFGKQLVGLFDFESVVLNDFSKNLATVHYTNTTNYLRNSINNTQRNIRDLETTLTEKYNQLRKYQKDLNAYSTATEDDVRPFMDTIISSKAIEIMDGDATNLRLRVTAPLQFFTPSDFEAYEQNPNSTYNISYTNTTVRSIMHKIFVTKEYSLIFQSIIKIRLNMNNYSNDILYFEAQRNNIDEFTELPNPHLYRHNCWGQAQTEMQKNIAQGNYELVVMQMIAATQTMNVAESASFINGALEYLKNDSMLAKTHVIDNATKQVYSWADLIKHERGEQIEEAKEQLTQEQETQKGYHQIVVEDEELTPEEQEILNRIQNENTPADPILTRMQEIINEHNERNRAREEQVNNIVQELQATQAAQAAQTPPDVTAELLRGAAQATQALPETYWVPEEELDETH